MTDHFSLSELTRSEYASRWEIDNTPIGEAVANLQILAEGLERARTVLGNAPMIVTSGYRCAKVNSSVGGSRFSYHQRGLAADFHHALLSPLAVCKALEAAKSFVDYDKIILEYGAWTHIQFQDTEIKPRREEYTIRSKATGYRPGILEG